MHTNTCISICIYILSLFTIFRVSIPYMSCSKKGFKGKIMPIILSVSKKLVRILIIAHANDWKSTVSFSFQISLLPIYDTQHILLEPVTCKVSELEQKEHLMQGLSKSEEKLKFRGYEIIQDSMKNQDKCLKSRIILLSGQKILGHKYINVLDACKSNPKLCQELRC